MTLRPFKLPADIQTLIDIVPPAFQYPENPAWSLHTDEMQNLLDDLATLRRLYPLLRGLSLAVPALRDIMRGFVVEVDGRPVGLANLLRDGTSGTWMIGNVAVLPDYRRQGYARLLTEACLDYARQRQARAIILDVVKGNTPAFALYKSLGFSHYADLLEYDYTRPVALTAPSLPPDYRLEPLTPAQWRTRFTFEQRLTPAEVQAYRPVEAHRFRRGPILRPLQFLVKRMVGVKGRRFALRRVADGRVLAITQYLARQHAGGYNTISVRIDRDCAALAPALVSKMVQQTQALSPGRRIRLEIPGWQPQVREAAKEIGFVHHLTYQQMGMLA